MSDLKKAQLGLAKLDAEAAQAGLGVVDGPDQTFIGRQAVHLDANEHEVVGTLNGTFALDAQKSVLNHTDVFDFGIAGSHNFNVTLYGFQPQTWNGSTTPNWDYTHDLLNLKWDYTSGVTTTDQAHAAEHVALAANGHDYVLSIDTATVHGTITFAGLQDYLLGQSGNHWGWHEGFNIVV